MNGADPAYWRSFTHARPRYANLYYHWYAKIVVGAKWPCTVVKDNGDDAFVVTAYLTDKPKKGWALYK